jgi:hypothetical protein
MGTVEAPAGELEVQRSADQPVMVHDWAEAVIDLGRWQSRRRHPSNQEPSWEKDGGDQPMEWVI